MTPLQARARSTDPATSYEEARQDGARNHYLLDLLRLRQEDLFA